MSHLQGTDYVGSMVVLEDGLPRQSEYRRFRIRDVPGNDDYAAMEEVLTRRLTALLRGPGRDQRRRGRRRPASARARQFAYPPQLLLLDGGKGQLGVGVRVLERLGLADEIPWRRWPRASRRSSSRAAPTRCRIPRGSEALFLLQRVRDEAHRFAISLPPQPAGQAHDPQRPRGGRPASAPPAGPGCCAQFGSVKAAAGRLARGARRRCRGCPTPWPGPSTTTSTSRRPAPNPGSVTPLAPALGQDGSGPASTVPGTRRPGPDREDGHT